MPAGRNGESGVRRQKDSIMESQNITLRLVAWAPQVTLTA